MAGTQVLGNPDEGVLPKPHFIAASDSRLPAPGAIHTRPEVLRAPGSDERVLLGRQYRRHMAPRLAEHHNPAPGAGGEIPIPPADRPLGRQPKPARQPLRYIHGTMETARFRFLRPEGGGNRPIPAIAQLLHAVDEAPGHTASCFSWRTSGSLPV